MTVHDNLCPYLGFRNTAREALELYADVLGGNLTLSTFGEFGMAQSEDESQLVMHGQITVEGKIVLMGSDTPAAMDLPAASSTKLALFGGHEDDERLRGYWDRLVDGGTVDMPLELAPWGDAFGQVTDRFGTTWFVNIAGEGQQIQG